MNRRPRRRSEPATIIVSAKIWPAPALIAGRWLIRLELKGVLCEVECYSPRGIYDPRRGAAGRLRCQHCAGAYRALGGGNAGRQPAGDRAAGLPGARADGDLGADHLPRAPAGDRLSRADGGPVAARAARAGPIRGVDGGARRRYKSVNAPPAVARPRWKWYTNGRTRRISPKSG